MTTIHLTHDYDAPARQVWRICTDFDALAEVCKPLVTFEGLPSGRLTPDLSITVNVRLFGVMPPQAYTMALTAYDDAKMTFASAERGAGVRRWNHTLRVRPVGERGARIEESIDIDAGLMTPLYAAWARKLYRHRHAGRLRLLARPLVRTPHKV